jgi:hypothetical protein
VKTPGFWEKKLTDDAWHFVPDDAFSAGEIGSALINDSEPEYGPVLLRNWKARSSLPYALALGNFGAHSNFFEPARLELGDGSGRVTMELYTHLQMRTSRARRAIAHFRGRKKPSWLGAYVIFPETAAGGNGLPAGFLELLRADRNDRYARLLLRYRGRRIELIRPLIPLNADFMNLFNRLFGKRIAVFVPERAATETAQAGTETNRAVTETAQAFTLPPSP